MKLDEIKLAFFDLDGVLAVPRFDTGTGIKCALTDYSWFKSCNMHGDVYGDCVPIPQTKELLEQLSKTGTKLYVLTHETNSGAYFNKVNFVLTHYREYFRTYEQVLFVSKKEQKSELMNILCDKYGLMRKQCLLVEDTYNTCITASNEGYSVIHISELLLNGGDFS